MDPSTAVSSAVILPLRRMWERVDRTAPESDVAYFYDLLNLGELLLKLVVAALVTSIDNRDGHRYLLERSLIHANGLGVWVSALDEALSGPSRTMMRREAYPYQQEITQKWSPTEQAWQRDAIEYLDLTCREIDRDLPQPPPKVSLEWWFTTFVLIRNRTRGHGSTLPGKSAVAAVPLAKSLSIVTNNLATLRIPCAVIRRNLSGKYRVVPLTALDDTLKVLKQKTTLSYPDGVYFSLGDLRLTPVCYTDIDLSDVHIANGDFRPSSEGATYEVLSYITDSREHIDGSDYLELIRQRTDSETHGTSDLEVIGKSFTNLPPQADGYVTRTVLEQELTTVLLDERHPMVSLVGRGGIGKTSLALKVLHELCHTDAFDFILWFSARDIDLLSEGPRSVRPQVLTFTEIAKEFIALLRDYDVGDTTLDADEYLTRTLLGELTGYRYLVVVDNFETVRNPKELFRTLDTHVRLPNKVLITGRHRDFKADYPVEVTGMVRSEYDELVRSLAIRLNISSLLSTDYRTNLYEETEGHPYLIKVILGEVATNRRATNVQRVLAHRDRMLDALFERSYATLTPAAQRVFLTLCNWRSVVSQLELEAALMRPQADYLDVTTAVDSLSRYSMVEVLRSQSDIAFLRVPDAARIFGKKKLKVSHVKPVVDVDTRILQTLGDVRTGDIRRDFHHRLTRISHNVAKRAALEEDVSTYMAILEYIATIYPRAWLAIAGLRLENPQLGDAIASLDAVERYLQEAPDDADAWRRLATSARDLDMHDREMNALYRLANLPGAPLESVSRAAACLSRHWVSGLTNVGLDEKRLMARRLAQLMSSKRSGANGTDFSRLAWLHLYLKEAHEARACVQEGLETDPGNTHLLKLEYRLSEKSWS